MTSCSPRALPAAHQHAPTYARPVHACARHRQVLSNRRVLSIINVYRMRNRVQARPRYHPPLSARPSSAVHLRCRWPAPTLHLARFCAALSFRESAFVKIRPRAGVVSKSQTRLSFGLPLITSPVFFSLPSFFFFYARGTERRRQERQGGNVRRNERTNERRSWWRISHFSPRSYRSFFRYEAKTEKGGGGGGGGGGGREMIFSPELNYGRAMECACYSFAALRWWARHRRCDVLCNPPDYDYFSD